MRKPLIFTDFDGCIAAQCKIWYIENIQQDMDPDTIGGQYSNKRMGVYKQVSDHDAWAIDHFKDKFEIVIISGDKRVNRAWADRRKVDFIFTGQKKFTDKIDYLKDYCQQKYGTIPKYYYLGDSMPDFLCMKEAEIAFFPSDASIFLKHKVLNYTNIFALKASSGNGCFEEMMLILDGIV